MSSNSTNMASTRSSGSGYVDPGWEHGIAQDDRKKKVQCKYCGKVVSGGIYRLKQHLGRISGEVTYCDKAPDEVSQKMRENVEGSHFGKKPRRIEHEHVGPSLSSPNFHDHEGQIGKRKVQLHSLGYVDKSVVINASQLRSLGYVDPGWEHGVPQDERKKKVKCNYCAKVVSGGINRFKQHLAGIPGEVAACKNVPEEVHLKIKENMKWHRTGRRHKQESETKEISLFYAGNEMDERQEDEEEEEEAVYRDKRRNRIGFSPNYGSELSTKRPRFDANVVTLSKRATMEQSRKSRREVMSAICRFFYHAGVPSHAANSPCFHKMLELIGQYGPGLAGPTSQLLSGRFLQDEIVTIKNYLAEYRASWPVTGCSILVDSWQDMQQRTLINFLVSCPRGVYFVRRVDVTDTVDKPTFLFTLLDEVVEEMGEENVVQVITANTPSFRAAGQMLEERRTHLFWTPCAAYCTDKILEDFTKIDHVHDCLEKCQKITKLIYNRSWLLNLMKREVTQGKEILKPCLTRSASSFATLQCLLDHKTGLRRMFCSNKWLCSKLSKLDIGKEVKSIVMDSSFWKKVQYVWRSADPVLKVLEKATSFSLPFVYDDMRRAKIAIKENHNEDVRKYGEFWRVVDDHCSSLFHHPLYLAAYILNPMCRYRHDFVLYPDVVRGLTACIARLEPDSARRISSSMQISDFGAAKADFGTDLAISTRSLLDPAAWWQQHGINCLELQRIAVRILSQTCMSCGFEHNWSLHDQNHGQRHNRLAQKRLDEAVFVHYNLRLRERQIGKRHDDDSVSLDSVLQENLLYDWIVETEKETTLQEDEEIVYGEMEQGSVCENDYMENGDGYADSRKGLMEMVALAEPPETNPCDTDDDDDTNMNFLDDDDDDDDDDDTSD